MSSPWSWARSPLFHFVLFGGLLFAAEAAFDSDEPERGRAVRAPIVLSAEQLRALESDFRASYGAAPSPAQRSALVEQAIQDEILYREARVLALGLEDGSVRRRLVEKMRALSDRPGSSEDVLVREAIALGLDDDLVIRRLLAEKMRLVLQQDAGESSLQGQEVRAYVERHRAELVGPATLTLSHVFFAGEPEGATEATAASTLGALRSGALTEAQAFASSDAFPLGNPLRAYSQPQLQGRFGKAFAESVFALAPGEWSGPIQSPFGLHLVRIDEKLPSSLPPLETLRPIVMRAVAAERAQRRLASGLERLRTLYEVRIEGSEMPARG
jgi:hypothetical protein